MPFSVDSLWRRAAQGDHAAFSQIVQEYQHKVFSYALRHCRNQADAEDIAQEVFLQVYKALPRFRGDASLSSWIFRITSNLCIDYARRKKKNAQPLSDFDEETLAFLLDKPDDAPTPDEALLLKEEREALVRGLACLTQQHREILLMREMDGLTYEEIASVCQLPLGTVRSRLARARLALRRALAEEEKEGNLENITE